MTVLRTADEIAAHTEEMLRNLRDMKACKFTVGQLLWLHSVSTHTRWGTTVAGEMKLNQEVAYLLERVSGNTEG